MARFITGHRTYNWTRKNPVIDKVRTILQDEGLYAKKKRNLLHQLSGVSVSTYDGWFEGETKDPKHTTIMATLTAVGYEEAFVKTKELDLEKELEVARAWLKKQEVAREKFNAEHGINGSRRGAAKKTAATKRGKK
jgi:transcriptional regulator with XRE-family HTH domain